MSDRTEKRIKCVDGATYFAAANSGEGFVSFYNDCFAPEHLEKRYLIKGGPGTGKSTLMKRIAKKARESGLDVEYYRCSSDAESLDAVLIDRKAAIIDATAPHCVEPEAVGACDELVDLGVFWKSKGLELKRDEISYLSSKKKECYNDAYALLCAADRVRKTARKGLEKCYDLEKMRRCAQRIVRRIPSDDDFSVRVGLCRSFGMTGRSYLDSYEHADGLYLISDVYGSAAVFLRMLIDEGKKNKNALRVSFDPLEPDRPDALMFLRSGTAFVTAKNDVMSGVPENKSANYINMKRFVANFTSDTAIIRSEYKKGEKLCNELFGLATDKLAMAGEYHFALEDIYIKCMDFDALGRFSTEFCDKVLDKLNKR